MTFKAVTFAIKFPDLSISERMTLIILGDCASKAGHAFPSQAYIAKRGGMSISTVIRAMKGLEKKKAIRRMKRFAKGNRTSDDYLILHERPHVMVEVSDLSNRQSNPSSPIGVGIGEEKSQPVMRIVGGVDHGN